MLFSTHRGCKNYRQPSRLYHLSWHLFYWRHKWAWPTTRPLSSEDPAMTREVSTSEVPTVLFYSCFTRCWVTITTPCPKKTKQICLCQNFVKFPPILIIFGRKMGNDPNICEVHSFSTSPNLRHHLTVLNANVPNCYITPKLLVIDRSHWRP